MASHRVVGAAAQRCFHLRAGLARSGDNEDDLTAYLDSNGLIGKERAGAEEVQAGDHQIAPKNRWIDAPANPRGDQGNMLGLQESHLPLAPISASTRALDGPVSRQPSTRDCRRGVDANRWDAASRP
jgi:hypothetical protein